MTMKRSDKPEHKDYPVFVDNRMPAGLRKKAKKETSKVLKEKEKKTSSSLKSGAAGKASGVKAKVKSSALKSGAAKKATSSRGMC